MQTDQEKEASQIQHAGDKKSSTLGIAKTLEKLTRREFMVRMVYIYAAVSLIVLFYFTASRNPDIFLLRTETLSVITDFYNAVTLLVVPFILGLIGALARVLIAGIRAVENIRIIFSSGLMAAFSWLSLKSKVFLALVSPYIPHSADYPTEQIPNTTIGSEFYSMALVAVLVGMFASNIYIAINQRVEKLVSEKNTL